MKFKGETLFFIGIIVVAILVVGGAILFNSGGSSGGDVDTSDLVTEDAHTKGSDDAAVTLVEFSDFQCPACRSAFPIVESIIEDYGDELRFVYRHFPLPSHGNARIAAQAAEAAGEQDKFWEMHDILFERQEDWAESGEPKKIFAQYADELEINVEQFSKALDENKFLFKVNQDADDGSSFGVNSTPTFFLNGERMPGVPDEATLKAQIEAIISSSNTATPSAP